MRVRAAACAYSAATIIKAIYDISVFSCRKIDFIRANTQLNANRKVYPAIHRKVIYPNESVAFRHIAHNKIIVAMIKQKKLLIFCYSARL
jgi:hypothetical protein